MLVFERDASEVLAAVDVPRSDGDAHVGRERVVGMVQDHAADYGGRDCGGGKVKVGAGVKVARGGEGRPPASVSDRSR